MQISKLTEVPKPDVQHDPTKYASKYIKSSSYYYSSPSDTVVLKAAIEQTQTKFEAAKIAHESNLEPIKNNQEIREQVENMMLSVGIPKTYQVRDTKSRKQIKPWITKLAGYVEDLHRTVPISDGYNEATWIALIEHFKSLLVKAEQAEQALAKQKEREQKERDAQKLADIQRATIVLKYNLDPLLEWEEIYQELLDKSPLLNLAIAMMDTRQDWSDGFYRVENAIFDSEDATEKEILSDVVSRLRGDETDGRIFRDTTWNYNRILEHLISTGHKPLVDDIMVAREESQKALY